MNKLLDAILAKMRCGGYVGDDNYDIVRFGLELLIMKTIIVTVSLIIAIITHSLIEVIVFMAAYQPLRSYCGGYHANTRIACIVSSSLMLGAVIILVRILPFQFVQIISLIITMLGVVVIILLSPIDTPTKPFDDIERKVFRRHSLVIMAILLVALAAVFILHWYKVLLPISLAFFCTAILLVIGKIARYNLEDKI